MVALKVFQLFLKIAGISKHLVIKVFPRDGVDHLLNEGIGERDNRDALDLPHVKNVQVGLPGVKGEQRIVIRAQVSWPFFPNYDGVEHVGQGRAIEHPRLYAELNEPPRALIHHHEDPMALQRDGLTLKQIHHSTSCPSSDPRM